MNATTARKITDGNLFDPAIAGKVPEAEQFARIRHTLDEIERQANDAAKAAGVTAPVTTASKRDRRRKGESNMTSQVATQAPPATPNTMSFNDLLNDAVMLATNEGNGKDAQVKFDLRLVEAAFLGVLDQSPDKHGKGMDDATALSEAYVKARGSAIVFDTKAGNVRKLVSTTRKCIKLGMWPKGGNGEPLQTVNNLVSMRQTFRKDPTKAKKLDDAHNMLMRYATQQLKRDTLIDGDELRAFCFKSETDPRTGEEVLESIRDTAIKLSKGKIANCADLDNSPEITAIVTACNKRLSAIAKAKGGTAPAPKP